MAFNCRESVGTGPVALKVVPVTGAGAAFSGFTMDQLMCTSLFPHLLLVNEVGIFFLRGGRGEGWKFSYSKYTIDKFSYNININTAGWFLRVPLFPPRGLVMDYYIVMLS